MAQRDLNLGTPPAGTDGDTVRQAFEKVQANTTELYQTKQDGIEGLTSAGIAFLQAGDAPGQRTAIGLGNVNNTSDADKPVSTAQQAALNGKVSTADYSVGDRDKLRTIGNSAATGVAADEFLLARGNHVGSQPASTISDFAATVRSTLLTGLVAGSNAAISATDTILAALAKLQAQLAGLGSASARNAIGAGEVYARGGIVGTVSSDGSGVPTGAVIERGSNGNGTYTKFADGTLICICTFSLAMAANSVNDVDRTLPFSFVDTGYYLDASCQPQSSGDFYGAIYSVKVSTSIARVGFRNGATAQTVAGQFVAIGRWR